MRCRLEKNLHCLEQIFKEDSGESTQRTSILENTNIHEQNDALGSQMGKRNMSLETGGKVILVKSRKETD